MRHEHGDAHTYLTVVEAALCASLAGVLGLYLLEGQGTSMSGLLKDIDKLMLSIVQVRNEHGDAHGPSDGSSDLTSAEAAECVNVAGALGLFLLECHQAGSKA